MVLGNAGLLQLIGLTLLPYVARQDSWLGALFLTIAFPGQFLLLAAMLFPLVLAAALLLPRRWMIAIGVLAYSVLLLAMYIDTRVFALYRYHVNSIVWHLLVSGVVTQILPITPVAIGLAGLYLAGFIAAELVLAWGLWLWVQRRKGYYGWALAVLLVLLVLSGHVLHAWADANNVASVTKDVRYLPWAEMTRAGDFFEAEGWVSPKNQYFPTGSTSGLNYPRAPLTCNVPAHPLNVVWIGMDGWRWDMMNPQVTPQIWNFSRQALVFQHHLAAGNETRYGIFGVFYGLDSTYWDDMLGERRGPVMIDEMKKAGYRFAIYGSAPLSHPEFDLTAFAAIREQIPLTTPGAGAWERDQKITERFEAFLKQDDGKPFLGYLFYDATHEYDYPPDYALPFKPAIQGYWYAQPPDQRDPVPIKNRFMDSAHYGDSLIGQVLQALRASGHLKDTIVMISADHGEEFNDLGMGIWGHSGDFSRYQMQVPLVMWWPGMGHQELAQWTSSVDIVPTVMTRVLGCTNPVQDYSNGRDLFDTSPRPYLVGYNGIRMAVTQPERITVIYDFGGMDVVDPDYHPIPGAAPDPKIMQDVLRDTSLFYKR